MEDGSEQPNLKKNLILVAVSFEVYLLLKGILPSVRTFDVSSYLK